MTVLSQVAMEMNVCYRIGTKKIMCGTQCDSHRDLQSAFYLTVSLKSNKIFHESYFSLCLDFSKSGEIFWTFLSKVCKGHRHKQDLTSSGTSSLSTSGAWRRPGGRRGTWPRKSGNTSGGNAKWQTRFSFSSAWLMNSAAQNLNITERALEG